MRMTKAMHAHDLLYRQLTANGGTRMREDGRGNEGGWVTASKADTNRVGNIPVQASQM